MTQNNTWNVLFNQFPLLRDEINLFQNNPDIDYHSALRQFSNNFNTSNTSSNISANFNNIYNKYDLTIYSTSQQLSNTFNNIFNSNLINLNNAEKAFTDSSNYTNNTSNIILNYINDSNLSINNQLELKQNNLTASTNLLGIGSSITQIDAINISSGILPVSRGGIGTTILPNNQLLLGNITSIKSSSLLIYDNVNNRLGVNTTDLTYTLNVNGSINSTSLYQNGSLINFANFATDTELTDGLALKQNILTATTNLLGIGSSITQIDYNKITLNQLSFMSPLSKDVNNNVSIDLSSYLTNVNDASYVLKSGSTMSGSLNITGVSSKLTFGLRYENILVDLYNGTFGIGVENGFMNFSVPASSGYKFYNNTTTNIATITSEGNLNVSGNLQEAGTNLSSKYLQLSGGSLTNSLTISTGNLSITNATGILSMGSKFLSNIINLYSTSYGIGVPSATEIRFYSPASTNFKFYTGSANTCTITPEGNLNVSGNLQEAGTNLSSKYLQLSGGSLTNSLTISTGNLSITNATGILSMGSKFLSNIINLYSTSYGIGVPSATEIRFYSPASTNFKFYTGSANTCTITPEGNLNVSGNLQEAGTNLSSKYATINYVNNLVPATATSLTAGNKTINGDLTITNDIILNNIIRFNGDTNVDGQIYHSAGQLKIQFDDYLYFIATSGTDAYINVGKYYGVSYHTLSDERVKYDIHNFNDSNLIQNFLNLEPKFFKYVYKNNNSNINIKNELGFIAQEVEKIFPYAVSFGKDFIPNIYQNIECSNNQLIFNHEFDISFLNVNDILNIENKHIKIINIENNIITINESFNKSSVFVYGTQVNDFRSIDKTYLYSINILATQELIRINKEQKEIIENQQKRIESIENELILIKNKLGI